MSLPERPQFVSLCVLWLCFGAAFFLTTDAAQTAAASPFLAISPADATDVVTVLNTKLETLQKEYTRTTH